MTSNIQSIEKILQPDTNHNFNIVFNKPIANGQVVEFAVKVVCSNMHKHFEDFFSTQVIVPIRNLHIHLHLCYDSNPLYYYTQVLSDSLSNKQTEAPVEHEYVSPVHWHIQNPKLHFEYMIYWK